MKKVILFTVLILVFVSVKAFSFVIDGSYNDWGIDPANSHWIPGDSSSTEHGSLGNQYRGVADYNGAHIYYSLEDAVGSNGYLEPGYGGQNYDAEAAYLYLTDQYIYLGIVTGFPEEGRSSYVPSDIAFLFMEHEPTSQELISTDYQYGLTLYERGSFNKHALYKASGWETGVSDWNGAGGVTLMTGGDLVSNDPNKIKVEYGTIDSSIPRYFIEAQISKDLFGDNWENYSYLTIHWGPSCANDHLEVTAPVPEPATIILMGFGLICIGVVSQKKITA